MEIKQILVLGAGTMGCGIAQAIAQAGFFVSIFDINNEALIKARLNIEKNLKSLVEKNKIENIFAEEVKTRLSYISNFDSCLCDIIIEAIVEKIETKAAIFNLLAELNHSDLIFASNTSSISITDLQQKIINPKRVVGMHFFNPATIMPLVEVVKGNETSDDVIEQVIKFTKQINKVPVQCADTPGFIVNRVARPYYLEAMRMVKNGLASIENIDEIMEATGFKLGPFKLMDIIGLDINFAVSQQVYEALNKPQRLQPSLLQEEKVLAGKLGKKTGEGFYKY